MLSAALLPDFWPKTNPDGTWAFYLVKAGDTCSIIAMTNALKVADLATFNDKTT